MKLVLLFNYSLEGGGVDQRRIGWHNNATDGRSSSILFSHDEAGAKLEVVFGVVKKAAQREGEGERSKLLLDGASHCPRRVQGAAEQEAGPRDIHLWKRLSIHTNVKTQDFPYIHENYIFRQGWQEQL